ncbi:hypothetical protein Mgra_00002787 [Meloidogyne graminicola]|uniref:Potassium channel domain-containing protein n=1 Tax=Meloidogyne graminicola TaxID=189291 RepID=A0A8S9ZVS7_9BILA|nr:hypothetical protein Mgra_00002787 [Meloidogyne graminicola]
MFLSRTSIINSNKKFPLISNKKSGKTRRSLLLMGLTFIYLVFGAIIFSLFEYNEDERIRKEIIIKRNQIQQKYKFSKKDFIQLENIIIQSIPFSAGYQWKFLGSLYFCIVLISTIGYGNSTPNTKAGRLFCIIYALGGIPLGLVTFQSVGERINHLIKIILIQIQKYLFKNKKLINNTNEIKSKYLLFISFSIGCITISIATIVFHKKENWSIFDSAYYCMISLSTIGFGDFVPAQTNERLKKEPFYIIFILIFLLFVLILEFMTYNSDIVTARTKLKKIISIKMSTSFRLVSSAQKINTTISRNEKPKSWRQLKQSFAIRRKEKPKAIRKIGVFVEKIDKRNNKEIKKHQKINSSSLLILKDIYRFNYWKQKKNFCARRLPTPYIEHLN